MLIFRIEVIKGVFLEELFFQFFQKKYEFSTVPFSSKVEKSPSR